MLIFPKIPTRVPKRLDMLPTGGHKVDVVSFDVGVLQYIRQFNDIFTCLRKHRGKQMAQVMRERRGYQRPQEWEETTVCSVCGERIWSYDNAGTAETPLCQRCYDNYYTSCDRSAWELLSIANEEGEKRLYCNSVAAPRGSWTAGGPIRIQGATTGHSGAC